MFRKILLRLRRWNSSFVPFNGGDNVLQLVDLLVTDDNAEVNKPQLRYVAVELSCGHVESTKPIGANDISSCGSEFSGVDSTVGTVCDNL